MEAREIISAAAAECFTLSLRDTGHCVGGAELRLRDSVCNFDIDTSSDRMLVGGQLCAGGVAAASISFVGTVINSATL